MTNTDQPNNNDQSVRARHAVPLPNIVSKISRVLLGLALVLLLFYFVIYVAYAVNLIRFPYDYDQGEGFELVDVMMFSEGNWPYQDIETYPFYGSIYPPLYHVLLMPFAWLFGPQYWYGRLFSFLSTLGTAAAIGTAIYHQEKRTNATRLIALAAGLAFLASNIVYHIGPLFRQHISMIFFETVAIVVLAHAHTLDGKQRRKWLLAGFILLMVAGYTKQLAAFTAAGALAFMFIRNPRRSVIWGVGFGVAGVAIFAWITWATGGHWWQQTIVANVKDFYPDQALGLLRLFLRLHFWLLIPAMLLILYEVYFDRISIYSIWFAVLTPPIIYSAGTWGAGDSYYATPIAATCILSGIFAARTLNQDWTFRENYVKQLLINPFSRFTPQIAAMMAIVIPALYIGYGITVFHMPTEGPIVEQIADLFNIEPNADNGFYDSAGRIAGGYANTGHFTTQEDIEAGDHIVALINEIDPETPILSEEAAFSFATNREVLTNPVVLYILDQVDPNYDSGELVEMIENQEFGLIVLRAYFYPVAVNAAITTYYEEGASVIMNGFEYIIRYPKTDTNS
jgi:hypothetical protein